MGRGDAEYDMAEQVEVESDIGEQGEAGNRVETAECVGVLGS